MLFLTNLTVACNVKGHDPVLEMAEKASDIPQHAPESPADLMFYHSGFLF